MTNEFEEEDWDFWQDLGINCSRYDSEADQHLIQVFIETSTENHWYQDIAKRLGLDEHYVRLLMEILSSADFCEYGTSPRGAWACHADYEKNLARLCAWYERRWEQSFTPMLRNAAEPKPLT